MARLIACPSCGRRFQLTSPRQSEHVRCPSCDATVTLPPSDNAPSRPAVRVAISADIDRAALVQWLGLAGAVLLFIGVFCPIISLPIAGNINYVLNGRGDGV